MWSRASGAESTDVSSAVSATVRVSGPMTRPGYGGATGIRPKLGLSPTTPHHPAGNRTEPPMSVPTCSGPYPAAAAAPAPALEPPGVRPRSQGLRERWWKLDAPEESMP